MSTGNSPLNDLVASALAAAQDFVRTNAFFPFAVSTAVESPGEMVGVDPTRTPRDDEASVMMLLKYMAAKAARGEILTAAVVFESVVTDRATGVQSDAICILAEAPGASVRVFQTFSRAADASVSFGRVETIQEPPRMFSAPSGG
jgi:hypothetical protein